MARSVLWNQRVPMRDGATMAADVFLPEGDGPFPTVLLRGPYGRSEGAAWSQSWVRLVDSGYAFVTSDVRGRGDSDGDFRAFVHDSPDGYDTVEWAASQSWSTGRVGMVGHSYEGLTQWWAARAHPPSLACIAPMAVGAASLGDRRPGGSGVPSLYWIWWMNLVTGRTLQHPGAPSWGANYDVLPPRTLHERLGTSHEHWPLYLNDEIDYLSPDFALSADDWGAVAIPVLVALGWWDDQTTLVNWAELQHSPSADRARLLIGAWDHAGNLSPRPVLGGYNVAESAIDAIGYVERFLAEHLKPGGDLDPVPRCSIFRTGAMVWEHPYQWPNPAAATVTWELGRDAEGIGSLATGSLPGNSWRAESTFVWDPLEPGTSFTALDAQAWSDPPLDERYRFRRKDTLSFASEPLAADVRVSGMIAFTAHVSIDTHDADLHIGVFDVHEDGRAIRLGGTGFASVRLSRRDPAEVRYLEPGEVVAVEVPVIWVHHTFESGHRIALTVSGGSHPGAARNLGSTDPWQDAVVVQPTRITLHHDGERPSRLLLPTEP